MARHEEDARQEIHESRCGLYDDATRREHVVRAVEHLEAAHRAGEGDYRRQIEVLREDWHLRGDD
jgi:hypothetical protein